MTASAVPQSPQEYVEVFGAERITARMLAMAERALAPEPAFAHIIHQLEGMEEARYSWFTDPTFVDTGETRASLTGAGSGAIRQMGPEGLEFGTAVDQAHWHPQVLVPMTDTVSKDVGRTLLEYIVGAPVLSA